MVLEWFMLVSDWQLWAKAKKASPKSHCFVMRAVPAVIWPASGIMARLGCHLRFQSCQSSHTHTSVCPRLATKPWGWPSLQKVMTVEKGEDFSESEGGGVGKIIVKPGIRKFSGNCKVLATRGWCWRLLHSQGLTDFHGALTSRKRVLSFRNCPWLGGRPWRIFVTFHYYWSLNIIVPLPCTDNFLLS